MRIFFDDAPVDDEHMRQYVERLQPYAELLGSVLTEEFYTRPESALRAPFDVETQNHMRSLKEQFAGVRTVLLVGIGGSDLGTRAMYEALVHTAPVELICFDTIEPARLREVQSVLARHADPNELALIVVTKSGTTIETLTNAQIVYRALCERYGSECAAARSLVITDPDTPLARTAEGQGMTVITLPQVIGGRFSVFTPVGLVPLALLGLNIDAFCEGARSGIQAALPRTPGTPSAALVLAATLFEAVGRGVRFHEFLLFDPALEMLGKWYRQLLAESIGKTQTGGTRVGIMPTVAIGSTDLHSIGQLIFGGPNDRLTTLVACPSSWTDTPRLTEEPPFTHPSLVGKESGAVIWAIYGGVQEAYRSHSLPLVRIELDALNERELGACMGFQMATVMYLAQLMEVNAFDQPNVEAYKEEARKLLAVQVGAV